MTALGNLISWQKVDYDFNYHQMEFPCNINVLIASEGRSLLPVGHSPLLHLARDREGLGFHQFVHRLSRISFIYSHIYIKNRQMGGFQVPFYRGDCG